MRNMVNKIFNIETIVYLFCLFEITVSVCEDMVATDIYIYIQVIGEKGHQ